MKAPSPGPGALQAAQARTLGVPAPLAAGGFGGSREALGSPGPRRGGAAGQVRIRGPPRGGEPAARGCAGGGGPGPLPYGALLGASGPLDFALEPPLLVALAASAFLACKVFGKSETWERWGSRGAGAAGAAGGGVGGGGGVRSTRGV